jgi:hypothetical protein
VADVSAKVDVETVRMTRLLTLLCALALHGCIALDSVAIEACDSNNNCLRATARVHMTK